LDTGFIIEVLPLRDDRTKRLNTIAMCAICLFRSRRRETSWLDMVQGRKSTELDESLSVSAFENGVTTVEKTLGCLAKAGIQSSSETAMRKTRDRVEKVVTNSCSKEQFFRIDASM